MEVVEAIRTRRSIRGLEGPPLTHEEVSALIALALLAPAPHHTRPWRFVHVLPPRREALAKEMGEAWRRDMEADGVSAERQVRALERSRRQLIAAPTLLVGCLAGAGLHQWPDERRDRAEWTMAAHSFGAALQNILLAAHARGIAGYWISAPLFAQEAVRSALDLDAEWRPQACIALGRRSEAYQPFDRPAPDLGSMLIVR
jgi:coenzyme F420-0:L-glutamate ligase/coenzyme F420-1:gamma-L-glutamate ligase